MKLYEISKEFNQVLNLAESGEFKKEDLLDTLEAIELAFDDKAKNCLMIIRELNSNAEAAKKEIDRLSALKKSADSSVEWMEEYLRENMMAIKKDNLDLGIFKVTLKKPTQMVEVESESKIPAKYWVEIPASKKLDKVTLLSDLKLGNVEGAKLGEGKRALLVR